jgi:hypothetical protein
MSVPFTLSVPADPRYRVLAPELAGKYVELVGGSAADGKTLARAVSRAMSDFARSAGASADLELAFHAEGGEVEVTVRCGGRSTRVKHSLATPQL